MRPATTEGVEKPLPMPVTFHRSFGPSAGHSLSKPVSVETPVRSAPRQPGQSPGPALSWARAWEGVARKTSEKQSTITRLQRIAPLLKDEVVARRLYTGCNPAAAGASYGNTS